MAEAVGAARGGTGRELRFGEALSAAARGAEDGEGRQPVLAVRQPAGGPGVAAAAYRLGLTPNQVTLVSAAFSFAGGRGGRARRARPWPLASRSTPRSPSASPSTPPTGSSPGCSGGGSAAGEWLDHVVDCAKITALHTAVLIAFYRHFDLPAADGWLLVPLGFQLAAVLIFFGGLLTDKLKPKAGPRATPRPPRPSTAARGGPAARWTTGCSAWCSCCSAADAPSACGYAALLAVHAALPGRLPHQVVPGAARVRR